MNETTDNGAQRWTIIGWGTVSLYVVTVRLGKTITDDDDFDDDDSDGVDWERGDTYGPFATNDSAETFGNLWAAEAMDGEGEEMCYSWHITEVLAAPKLPREPEAEERSDLQNGNQSDG